MHACANLLKNVVGSQFWAKKRANKEYFKAKKQTKQRKSDCVVWISKWCFFSTNFLLSHSFGFIYRRLSSEEDLCLRN